MIFRYNPQHMFEQVALQIRAWIGPISGPVVVGVSGGPDSLALFHILVQQAVPVVVAHLDHGLRASASRDYQQVKDLAGEFGVEFYGRAVQVDEQAARTGQSIEEAARQVRYQFLFEIASHVRASAVAVGHNADDQVETILMHFLRGAGMDGLSGMQSYSLPNPWSTEIPLIRPLLTCWRDEILEYCQQNMLEPVQDETNLDLRFTRNRLRHQLISDLENYNPQVKTALLRSAALLRAEGELLQPIFAGGWDSCLEREGGHDILFRREIFKQQPLAVQRHIVKRTLQQLSERPGELYFEWVERGVRFSREDGGAGGLEIGAGIELYKNKEWLWFYRSAARSELAGFALLEAGQKIALPLPGFVQLGKDWVLRASWVDTHQAQTAGGLPAFTPNTCWLQVPEQTVRIELRGRRPGDRFKPLGMYGHTVKVADVLTSICVPAPIRDRWPLATVNEEIAWIPGYTISQEFRVDESESPILRLELIPKHADQA